MSPRLLKTVAVLLLASVIATLRAALWASSQRSRIQGPSALAVLADQSVWIGVDDALWHLHASGQRLSRVDAKPLGLGGPVSNLVPHPSGQLVATVRDDPVLYFLDPTTAAVLSRVAPQWPEELKGHASRAITPAFHDDGRVAISTGGGHAVALFDATGAFLARSQPGAYVFTNGLWWTQDSLWTTNTNGSALLALDPRTLVRKSQVLLRQVQGDMRYLGLATPSQGQPPRVGQAAPLATLVRFANGMVVGHATDVFGDGSQADFPAAATAITPLTTLEPRSIQWHGGELLLVDGATFAIKRYASDRSALVDFGDAAVQSELAGLLAHRAALQTQYNAGLAAAVVLFAFGFAAAMWAQAREKKQSLTALDVDLSQVGTPRLTRVQLLVAVVKMYWPVMLCFAAAQLLMPAARRFPDFFKTPGTPLLLLGVVVLAALGFMLFIRTLRRSRDTPAFEGVFNFHAMQLLKTDLPFWARRQTDELPRETLLMVGPQRGLLWLVLTNQRLLVHASNRTDRTLIASHSRRDIAAVRPLMPHEMSTWQRVQHVFSLGSATLRFEFEDGSTLQGATASTATARRLVALLKASSFDAPTAGQMAQTLRNQAPPTPAAPPGGMARWQVLASLLVPGLGQWMQGRSGTALRLFIGWSLLIVLFVVPMVWTLWAPRAAVPVSYGVCLAAAYALTCGLAAFDAWRMRIRRV
jgi:hypothetical protein